MASWMTEWAEKGGNLLNSLDKGVANLLNAESVDMETKEFTRTIPPPHAASPVQFPMKSSAPSAVVKPIPVATGSKNDVTEEERLFAFLNSPAPMEQALSTLQTTAPQVEKPKTPPPPPSPPAQVVTQPEKESEIALENRLLHQEVKSLNQEIADLIRRNKRAESDVQAKDNEIASLRNQLQEAKKIDSLTSVAVSTPQRELQSQVEWLSRSLESTKQALKESETKAAEAMKLSDISSGRVEQLRQEATRLSLSMATYKEKAAAVLAEKDKLIASLRAELKLGVKNPSTTLIEESEVQQKQEEYDRLRQEAEQRLLAAAEMEERAEEEHASLRRTLNLLEQQLAREKQLVADADAEIIDLQRRLTLSEEAAHQETEALTAQLHALEAEVSRLRRGGGASVSPSPPISPVPVPRDDTEARLFEMEAKARQLSDSLLTKQDALDATLAQNHALKIRLERLEAESDARLLAAAASSSFASGYPQLPQATSQGFARLHLIDTTAPDWLRAAVGSLDDWMIRLVAMLRRRPLIRLLLILYLGIFHVWLLCSPLLFAPPIPSRP